ncbi:MAG: tetratricopeptide repeat protein [Alphaproteobacteria bacterium]|nr:tetratricopeptide repeat protein [Alphaproteobacteria bacterium]
MKNKLTPEEEMERLQQEMLNREVDEDLQKERLANLWKKYGFLIYLSVILLVAGTAGFEGYKSYSKNIRLNESNLYEQALSEIYSLKGDAKQAHLLLSKLETGKTTYASLAKMQDISLLLKEEKKQEALSQLESFFSNKKTPEVLRDLATLFYVQNAIGIEDDEKLTALLLPFMTPKSSWYGSAAELKALIDIKNNKKQEALFELETALKTGLRIPKSVQNQLNILLTSLKES